MCSSTFDLYLAFSTTLCLRESPLTSNYEKSVLLGHATCTLRPGLMWPRLSQLTCQTSTMQSLALTQHEFDFGTKT